VITLKGLELEGKTYDEFPARVAGQVLDARKRRSLIAAILAQHSPHSTVRQPALFGEQVLRVIPE
jgi:hypothetical protein